MLVAALTCAVVGCDDADEPPVEATEGGGPFTDPYCEWELQTTGTVDEDLGIGFTADAMFREWTISDKEVSLFWDTYQAEVEFSIPSATTYSDLEWSLSYDDSAQVEYYVGRVVPGTFEVGLVCDDYISMPATITVATTDGAMPETAIEGALLRAEKASESDSGASLFDGTDPMTSLGVSVVEPPTSERGPVRLRVELADDNSSEGSFAASVVAADGSATTVQFASWGASE